MILGVKIHCIYSTDWAFVTFGEFLAAVLSKLQVIKSQRMTEGDCMELR